MRGRHPNPIVLEADAAYEIEKAIARKKGLPHSVTLRIIERRFGLKPNVLYSWRNNQFAPCKTPARRHAYYERKKNERQA